MVISPIAAGKAAEHGRQRHHCNGGADLMPL